MNVFEKASRKVEAKLKTFFNVKNRKLRTFVGFLNVISSCCGVLKIIFVVRFWQKVKSSQNVFESCQLVKLNSETCAHH